MKLKYLYRVNEQPIHFLNEIPFSENIIIVCNNYLYNIFECRW